MYFYIYKNIYYFLIRDISESNSFIRLTEISKMYNYMKFESIA